MKNMGASASIKSRLLKEHGGLGIIGFREGLAQVVRSFVPDPRQIQQKHLAKETYTEPSPVSQVAENKM